MGEWVGQVNQRAQSEMWGRPGTYKAAQQGLGGAGTVTAHGTQQGHTLAS